MGEVRVVLFDWHDTLVASREQIWEQDKYVARRKFGFKLSDREILKHWGQGPEVLYPALFRRPDMNWRAIQRIFQSYSHLFPRSLFDDTLPTLEALLAGGLVVAVVSGGSRAVVEADMTRTEVPKDRLAFVQCSDDLEPGISKPDRRILDRACGRLALAGIKARRDQIVYAGDDVIDWRMGRDAGTPFVGVTNGLITPAQFAAVDAVAVPHLADLPALLLG